MAISIVRLSSGEVLLGEVTATSDCVKITNTLQVITAPGQNGIQIGLIPFMPYTEESTLTFRTTDVQLIVAPRDDLRQAYDQQFGTGIVTPPEKKLVVPGV